MDAKRMEAYKGLNELIRNKQLQIDTSHEDLKRDLEAFRITSHGDTPEMIEAKKRIVDLVSEARERKIKNLIKELEVLKSADTALCEIAEIAGQNTTIDDPPEFNQIWELANRPYAVGIDWAKGCEPKEEKETKEVME